MEANPQHIDPDLQRSQDENDGSADERGVQHTTEETA